MSRRRKATEEGDAACPVCAQKFKTIEQANACAQKCLDICDEEESKGKPLSKVTAFLDIRSEPGEDVAASFKDILIELGANISSTHSSKVTHVIWKNGKKTTFEKANKNSKQHLVSVLWVDACQKSQSNADESLFTINQNITPVRAKKSMKPASVEMSTESYKDKQKRNRNSLVNTPTETHPNNPPTMRRLKRKKSQEPQEEAEQKIEILAEETQVVGIEFSDDSDCEESEMIVSTPNKKHTSILSGENPSETTPSNRKKTPENKKEKTPDSKKKTPQNKETTVKKKTPDSKKKKTLDSTAKNKKMSPKRKELSDDNEMDKPSSNPKRQKTKKATKQEDDGAQMDHLKDISNSTTEQKKSTLKNDKKKKGKKLYIAFSGLQQETYDCVVRAIQHLPKGEISSEVTEKTTHLISDGKRTTKFLNAISRGCWIISPSWAMASLEYGEWLPEADYELEEMYPGCKVSRLKKSKGKQPSLFSKDKAVYIGKHTTCPPTMLAELILLGGGSVAKTLKDAKVRIGTKGATDDEIPCVTESWVTDSVCQQKSLPWEDFNGV
eukprot:m.146473 g.146473  ORF g.146473 m.146473 type:complete len:554 (-) comp14973_c1_seq2:1645-3306(-)